MTEGGAAAVVVLYRAVGLSEASDIEAFGGLRAVSGRGFQNGKWFASTQEHAARWGRVMQRADGADARPFRIAEVAIPTSLVGTLRTWPRLDGIGPAYFAEGNRLPEINAVGRIRVLPRTHHSGDES